jgi:NAD(P)-dependent dehydrogenase (short-subunit alcohol dehydrogenase family)
MRRLDGKVAIVTGATSGIGLATAELFVAEGARVAIAGRRREAGEAIAGRLGAACTFRQTDVTDEEAFRVLVDHTTGKWGRLDVLFNNAGGPGPTGGAAEMPIDGFDACVALNLRSVMIGIKLAAPIMRGQGAGSIINNGSIAGLRAGYSSSIAYGAAKAAVIHLTRVVAMELGESNVRVNSISPGAIATAILAKALGVPDDDAERAREVIGGAYKSAQPIPRAGLAEDIARAALFLASDEASFVNGHDLVVDGGIIGGRNWTQQQEGLKAMRGNIEQAVKG